VTNYHKSNEGAKFRNNLKETLYTAALLCLGTCLYGTVGTDVNLIPRYLAVMMLFLVGVVLFYKKFRSSGSEVEKGTSFYDLILVAYCAMHFVSITWSQNFAEAVFEAGKSVVLIGGFFLLRRLLLSNKKLQTHYLKRINLLISGFLVLVIIYQFAHMMTNFNYPSPYHIKGFSSHKNLLASFLMLLVPLNIVGLLKERGGFRTLFIVVAGLQLTALVMLQSRAVYVGLVVFFAFFLFTNLSNLNLKDGIARRGKPILLGLFLILGASLGLSYFSGFLNTLTDKTDVTQFAESRSAKERIVLWKNSLELIAEKPVLGHGAGNWKIHFPRTGLGDLERASFYDAFFLRPHNDYVSVFTEMGVVGLLLFLSIFIVPMIWYFKTEGEVRTIELRLLMATTVGFLAVFFFDFPKERIEHQLYLALLLALIWVETSGIYKRRIGLEVPRLVIMTVSAMVLMWNLYSGYQRYDGDRYVNKIFAANERAAWKQMVSLTDKSTNTFFSIDPISNPIQWFGGVARFQLGKWEESEAILQEALVAHPNNHKVLNSLAGLYNRNNDFPKAIEYYEKALGLNPFYDNAILNLAITHFQAENLDEAERWVNKTRKESLQKTKLIEAIQSVRNQ